MEHIIARVKTLYKNNYNVNIIFCIIVTFQLKNKYKKIKVTEKCTCAEYEVNVLSGAE